MGVPEAAESAAVTDMRAVGVAVAVGVGVMLAVVGNPVEHRALRPTTSPSTANTRSSHGYVWNDRWVSSRWKPTVTPIAVSEIHRREDPEVGGIDGSVPEEHHGSEDADERDDHAEQVRDALSTGH